MKVKIFDIEEVCRTELKISIGRKEKGIPNLRDTTNGSYT